MTFEEIVRIEMTRTAPEKDWEDVARAIKSLPDDRVVRFNDSLFIFTDRGDGVASFAMCNADKWELMHSSMLLFCNFMKSRGFKKLLFSTRRRAMLRIGKNAEYPFTFRESDKQFFGEIYLDV